MQKHLRVSLNPFVELLIRGRRLTKSDLMRYHEAWLRPPSNDQVSQVAVVSLYVALAGSKVETFLEELAKGEEDLTLAGLLIRSSWISWDIQAGNSEACNHG